VAERGQLLKVEVPGLIAVEVLGPQPPKRVAKFAPSSARLVANSSFGKDIKIIQYQAWVDTQTDSNCEPFLFEETTYEFIIEIQDRNADPKQFSIISRGRKLPDPPRRVGKTNAYTCQINFGSQIGFLDLDFLIDNDSILFLGLEIFPSKIDYRQDFLQIRADIENEIRDLAFAVSPITFHKAKRRRDVRAGEVEWLENIRQLFSDLDRAFNRIKIAPRYTIYVDEQLQKANRPSRAGASVRRYIRSHASECVPAKSGHFRANGRNWQIRLLPSERKKLTYDTVENRYIKWALFILLRMTRKNIKKFQSQQFQENNATISWRRLLEDNQQRIRLYLDAAFLKDCNDTLLVPFQSLALHMAPGYREFFTTFLDILSGLKITGGPFELSEKNLAILYEMWCFIKLGNILRKDLKVKAVADWLNVGRKGIGVALQKGKPSVLSLVSPNEETIRLLYNPKEETPTGTRYPDNILEIEKTGSTLGFHYIFDAKYRLCDDDQYVTTHWAPGPPEDAINKMHAYRDQIVAEEKKSESYVNEDLILWDWGNRKYFQKAIAGFILFPYAGLDADKNRFFKSINKVGIGGLPFLPGRTREVEQQLKSLMNWSTESEEDRAITLYSKDERKRIAMSHQYGLMGILRHPQQLDYIQKHRIYHMPYTRLRGARLRADFLLFFQSKRKFGENAGIQFWAKVKSFQVGQRTDIRPAPPWQGHKDDLYAWFKVNKIQRLSKPIPPSDKGYPAYFRVTTRLAFEEAESMEELSLIREPERRLYHELKRSGFDVQVREDSRQKSPTYDISKLRLILRIYNEKRWHINLTFDPQTSDYLFEAKQLFNFEDLMYSTELCLEKIDNIMHKMSWYTGRTRLFY